MYGQESQWCNRAVIPVDALCTMPNRNGPFYLINKISGGQVLRGAGCLATSFLYKPFAIGRALDSKKSYDLSSTTSPSLVRGTRASAELKFLS